jgi:hypothetical protein
MAKATSAPVPDYIPAEPELLHPAAKQVLRLMLATGSLLMLAAFVVVIVVAVF